MSLITESYINKHFSIPASLPSTQLDRDSWIVVSAFKLQGDMTAQYLWSTLTILDAGSPPHAIVSPPGLVTVGLYKDFDNGLRPRSQIPVETVAYAGTSTSSGAVLMVRAPSTASQEAGTFNIDGARYFVIDPTTLSEGNYSIVVANNSSDHDYAITMTGSVKVNIG